MTRIIVKTMTELLSILALATKQLKESRLSKWITADVSDTSQGGIETYVKLLLGDRGVLDAVQKLDKLTREEAQMTGTQILKVTHDLMSYMKTVMDGEEISLSRSVDLHPDLMISSTRSQSVDGWDPRGSRYACLARLNLWR
jgi:hypothetical protein